MAIDFGNLKPLAVDAMSEAEYVFEDIPGEPSIWSAPALDSNIDFLNERLRMASDKAERADRKPQPARRKKGIDADDIEESREDDRVLMARHCARRWGVAPRDINGDQPEFSEENCLDFFRALPNYMFDGFRSWASAPRNFIDKARLAELNPQELGNG